MINLKSFDTLGQNGLAMMQNAMNTSNAASAKVMESTDPMSIAEASMDMSTAKVQMAVGAWLVNAQNEMMEQSLQIFGIGTQHSGLY